MSDQYTIVQHSGYGYAGDHTFRNATETRKVSDAQAKKVLEVGGRVFPDYVSAEDACENYNYPVGVEGLVPRVTGTFAPLNIDGLSIYIPAPLPDAPEYPVYYVTDPEADASWVQATMNAADEIVIEDGMIIAVQRERFFMGEVDGVRPIKVEWRWVMALYENPLTMLALAVGDHRVVSIQSVMETV